jgi:hypothetical protein
MLKRFTTSSQGFELSTQLLEQSSFFFFHYLLTRFAGEVLEKSPYHLTRERSATAGEGERGLQRACFNKVERGIGAAGGWLHRLDDM